MYNAVHFGKGVGGCTYLNYPKFIFLVCRFLGMSYKQVPLHVLQHIHHRILSQYQERQS